jgi:hypothetical protein
LGYDAKRLDDWDSDLFDGRPFSAAAVCGKPPTQEDAAVRQLLADLATMELFAIEVAAAVRSSKGIGWQIERGDPTCTDPSISTVGWMNRFFSKRAMLRTTAGDAAGAMDDLGVIYEYLQLLYSEPRTLLSSVIGTGISSTFSSLVHQIAQMPSIGTNQLLEINKWLEFLENEMPDLDCYRIELVLVNETVSSMCGSVTAFPPDQMGLDFDWMDVREWWSDFKLCWWQLRPAGFFKSDLADALLRFDREILHLTDGTRRESSTVTDANRIEAYLDTVPVSGSTFPGLGEDIFGSSLRIAPPMIRKNLKVRTWLRLCRTGIAAELYRREHGCLPASLGDLVPVYLETVPLDAFSETPLRMEVNADGSIAFIAQGVGNDTNLRLPVPKQ